MAVRTQSSLLAGLVEMTYLPNLPNMFSIWSDRMFGLALWSCAYLFAALGALSRTSGIFFPVK